MLATQKLPISPAALDALMADALAEAKRRKKRARFARGIEERYANDWAAFIRECCQIYDSVTASWIPFSLWDEQVLNIEKIHNNQLVAWLKSRQLGASWSVLAYGLWEMIFHPIQEFLVFSRTATDAEYLLGIERLQGMFSRLPSDIIEYCGGVAIGAHKKFQLGNGSTARAFPTCGGDGYTATLALVDEADLAPDLDVMLSSIKPTVEAGGKLVLVSRSDKRRPNSIFKKIFKDAMLKKNDYTSIFSSWRSHPKRDDAWYEEQVRNATSMDDVYGQYPSTANEALARGAVGLVYPRFSDGNISEKAVYNPSLPVEWWVDDGYTNPLVIAFAQEGHCDGYPDRLIVFDEIYVTQTDHDLAIQTALDKGYAPPSTIWCDPSAARLLSRFVNARNYGVGMHPPFYCQVNAANNDVAQGIKAVRHAICDGNSYRRLVIHPRCENVIRDLSEYAESESGLSGGDPKPVKENDHGADAVRYGMTPRMYTGESL